MFFQTVQYSETEIQFEKRVQKKDFLFAYKRHIYEFCRLITQLLTNTFLAI